MIETNDTNKEYRVCEETISDTPDITVKYVRCLNCGKTFEGNYCPNCGQSAKTGKLKLIPVIKEIIPVIYSFDTRLLRTIKELFSRPGHMINDYISGHRISYYKPISLIFLIATLYLLAYHFLNGEDITEHFVFSDNEEFKKFWESHKLILDSLKELMFNKAWMAIISVSLWYIPFKMTFGFTKRGRDLSLAEFFYSMVYYQCIPLTIETIALIFSPLFSIKTLVSLITFIYQIVFYKQFLNISTKRSFWLLVAAWALLWILTLIALIIIGVLFYYSGLYDYCATRFGIDVS